MRHLADADVLALWERGAPRHPLDRALVLCAWAREDLDPTSLADLPLGVVNAALVTLRRASFGSRIEARVDCERCGEPLEIALDAGALAAAAPGAEPGGECEIQGFRFRAPSTRDLAAVAGERSQDDAALRLLDRCCVARPAGEALELEALVPEVERALERLDPAADLELALTCEACGHAWQAGLDIAALLWNEVAVRAGSVLADVHRLALAYGWTEREILRLSPARRAAYLQMVEVASA